MYMSDSDEEDHQPIVSKNQRFKRKVDDDDDDESVMGLSNSEDEDLDGDESFDEEDDDDDDRKEDLSHDYDDFDEEEDEFGNVHEIRAKKQEMGSDIEDNEEEYMPDARAWGASAKNYIGADYVDNDGEGITDKHRMIAEAEEEEGIATQKRLLDQLDEDALDFDLFPEIEKSSKLTNEDFTVTKLDQLSRNDKLAYLKKESPELFLLIDDYKRLMNESEQKITQAMKELKKLPGDQNKDDLYQFMCLKNQLILRYCLNVNFYMVLKSKGKQTKNHPIRQTLILYRKMLKEVQEYQEKLGYSTIEALIEQLKKNLGQNKMKNKTIINAENKKKRSVEMLPEKSKRVKFIDEGSVGTEEMVIEKKRSKKISTSKLSLQEQQQTKQNALKKAEDKLKEMEKDAEYYSDEEQDEKQVLFVHKRDDVKKRKISKVIEKNKGLTPYRKKDYRNPRIRYKSKYVKAEKKRRSQVKDPVKEINKYAGEFHGIKAGVVRSVKIKQ